MLNDNTICTVETFPAENDIFTFITQGDFYNYTDDNTIGAVADSILEIKNIYLAQSNNAIKWFDENLMEANPENYQVIALHQSDVNIDLSAS